MGENLKGEIMPKSKRSAKLRKQFDINHKMQEKLNELVILTDSTTEGEAIRRSLTVTHEFATRQNQGYNLEYVNKEGERVKFGALKI
jgi:5S rRNA maturation endonuclease (ribonuclease M5)